MHLPVRKDLLPLAAIAVTSLFIARNLIPGHSVRRTLSPEFTRKVLAPVLPEAPLELRLFVGPVKTDSSGRIITGPTNDPVKNLTGAEDIGVKAGIERPQKSRSPSTISTVDLIRGSA